MKFKDAKIGMKVKVTGEFAHYYPKGGIITTIDSDDSSVEVTAKSIHGDIKWWFWDKPNNDWLDDEGVEQRFKMEDLYPSFFDALPLEAAAFAVALGIEPAEIECHIDKEKGIIKVKKGNIITQAKKSPVDKWDLRLGFGLALCRLKEKIAENKKPGYGERCFSVLSGNGLTTGHDQGLSDRYFDDAILYAMGNAFRTQKQAKENVAEMVRRTYLILKFCEEQGWCE